MVPPRRWCGVRACEFRNSPFGLLSERTTSFSYGDAICSGGKVEPNCKLHCGSLSGSAAGAVAVPAVGMGAAMAIPCPRNARRLDKPVPGDEFRIDHDVLPGEDVLQFSLSPTRQIC